MSLGGPNTRYFDQDEYHDSDDLIKPKPYEYNINHAHQENEEFQKLRRGLDEHLDELNRLQSIKEEQNQNILIQQENVPVFNKFISKNYRQYSRESPTRQDPLGSDVKKSVISSPKNKVDYLQKSLRQELRTLKIYTIIDKNSEQLEEVERDLVSLHHEMPKYFSKPRLYGQNLPEVVRNKKNMMTVLRGIKSRDERRKTSPQHSKKFSQPDSRNVYCYQNSIPQSPFNMTGPIRSDPPPHMYSRSFMYVKNQPPNMRLDISKPRVQFNQNVGIDIQQSLDETPKEIKEQLLRQARSPSQGSLDDRARTDALIKEAEAAAEASLQYTQGSKDTLVRTSQNKQIDKPPRYQALKIKNEHLVLPSHDIRAQTAGTPQIFNVSPDIGNVITYYPRQGTSSTQKRDSKVVHVIPQAPFQSIFSGNVLSNQSPSSSAKLQNQQQFSKTYQSPFSFTQTGFATTQGSSTKNPSPSPFRFKSGLSNNQNGDNYYENNKMLKPLTKEKSLLQKLYRESLNQSPSKVPKIAKNKIVKNPDTSTQAILNDIYNFNRPQTTVQEQHIDMTFQSPIVQEKFLVNGTIQNRTTTDVNVPNEFRKQAPQSRNYTQSKGTLSSLYKHSSMSLKTPLVKIPTVETVRSNITQSSLGSLKNHLAFTLDKK